MSDQKIEYIFKIQKFMEDIRRELPEMSLREMSIEVDVSASTLSRIDKGFQPDLQTFMLICGALQLNPADYFGRMKWVRVEDKEHE